MSLDTEFAPADPAGVADALELVNAAFDTPLVMVSHIDGETYTVVGIDDRLDTGLEVGAEFETAQTFCHAVVGDEQPVTVLDAGDVETFADLPARQNLGLDAYLGVPLHVDDEFYGTLAICDTRPRDFDDADVALAKTAGRLVERAL